MLMFTHAVFVIEGKKNIIKLKFNSFSFIAIALKKRDYLHHFMFFFLLFYVSSY